MPEEVRSFARVSFFGLALGAIYWSVSYEIVGTVLLLGFGGATALLAVLLYRDARSRGATERGVRFRWRWILMGDSGADQPLADEEGRIPDSSLAPLLVGLGVAVMSLSIAFGAWFIAVGAVPALVGLVGWVSSASREFEAVADAPEPSETE
jgi:hypothetical protein